MGHAVRWVAWRRSVRQGRSGRAGDLDQLREAEHRGDQATYLLGGLTLGAQRDDEAGDLRGRRLIRGCDPLDRLEQQLHDVAEALKAQPEHLVRRAEQLLERVGLTEAADRIDVTS